MVGFLLLVQTLALTMFLGLGQDVDYDSASLSHQERQDFEQVLEVYIDW